jgi:hypothetical protein
MKGLLTIGLAAASLAVAGALPARAVTTLPVTIFDFSGVCSDCSGTATAELTLSPSYALGDELTSSNRGRTRSASSTQAFLASSPRLTVFGT